MTLSDRYYELNSPSDPDRKNIWQEHYTKHHQQNTPKQRQHWISQLKSKDAAVTANSQNTSRETRLLLARLQVLHG